MAWIEIQQLEKTYRLDKTDVVALHRVDLTIDAGERVCLMGPSGSGKSTLLNIVGCIDKATSGTVRIAGKETHRLSDARLADYRNRTLGFVFQNFNLIPVLSVFENVEYPLILQKVPVSERKTRVNDLLERVGLGDLGRRRPERLSGGQRQRVAIARALVTRPRLVVADEPTASLDHETGRRMMDLLIRLNDEEQSTLLFATHDAAMAGYATRIIRMTDGRVERVTA